MAANMRDDAGKVLLLLEKAAETTSDRVAGAVCLAGMATLTGLLIVAEAIRPEVDDAKD